MIRSNLLKRKELVDMILKAPKTPDGFYFFPRFKILVLLPGPYGDNEFFYSREIFKKKMCFSITDIKLFLARKEMATDLNLLNFIDQKIEDTLKGYEFLSINDKIPKTEFTLGELIDTCIYFVKEKYS